MRFKIDDKEMEFSLDEIKRLEDNKKDDKDHPIMEVIKRFVTKFV